MDWKAMADKAKQVFQQRGGAQAAKEDAQELRDISQEQGSYAGHFDQQPVSELRAAHYGDSSVPPMTHHTENQL